MQEISRGTIIQAAKGDIDAFEEIYRKASGYIYTIAYRVTANKEDAEEVTQDVFLKVHKNLFKFMFKSSLKTWMYRITVNTAINLVNKRKRKTGNTVPYEEYMTPSEEDRQMEKKEAKDEVNKMLEILPPDQKACIALKEIGGLKYEEIAASLGVKINTVRTRIKRAREKLIMRYKEAGHEM